MKYKYMKSTEVVMLFLLGFVACESKSNYAIFSTSLIKKPSSLSAAGGGGEGVEGWAF